MRARALAFLILCLLSPALAAQPGRADAPPDPPAGEWLSSAAVPGFRFKVRIAGATAGRKEAACIGETLCVSGALAGRSEVFLRVVGPKPNGRLWPTLVKFSTSLVEVWVEQTGAGASDEIRYYQLAGSGQGSSLPGVVDRSGFPPTAGASIESDEKTRSEPLQTVSASLFADLWPGAASGKPRSFVRSGGLIYFFADSPGVTNQVWRTDGTAAGTFRVTPEGLSFRSIWPAESGLAYFQGPSDDPEASDREAVWRSDGTEAGTFRVATTALLRGTGLVSPIVCYVPELNRFFFVASELGASNFELWVSDGTAAGTHRLVDLNPNGGSYPGRMFAFDGRLVFSSRGPAGSADWEIWTSDGTEAGTHRIRDLYDGPDGVQEINVEGGTLLFLAGQPLQLWRSDGTEAGTVKIADTNTFSGEALSWIGGRLFFSLSTSGILTDQLWATNGSLSGATQLLQVPDPGPDLDWGLFLAPVGNQAFFNWPNKDFGSEPAISDGTPGGTRRLADLCPGACSSSPHPVIPYKGRLVFNARDGVSGNEPWITNGTAAGTVRLGDLCPGECSSFAGDAVEIGGSLIFSASSDEGRQIWTSDGTAAGTVPVTDFPEGFLQDVATRAVGVVPGGLLLVGQDEAHGEELWFLPLETTPEDPEPPAGAWITSASMPGFRVKARLTAGSEVRGVRSEPCIGETLCLSGALPGRPELFVRVVGPKPNGYLWPTLVRFTTSTAEVWIEQLSTGTVRYYRMEAPARDSEQLDGFFDRTGFLP